MTIGIYALVFNGYTQIYIGQSKNIEHRYIQHLYHFRSGKKHNAKLLAAYSTYGEPELLILEECNYSELDSLEIQYINEYNTFHDGLNAAPGGNLNPISTSKASKEAIIEVFQLLLDHTNQLKTISEVTGVSITIVRDIARLSTHIWLKEAFPSEYAVLEEIKHTKLRLSRKLSNYSDKSNYVRTKKLSPSDILDIRAKKLEGTKVEVLANTYNVSKATIYRAL